MKQSLLRNDDGASGLPSASRPLAPRYSLALPGAYASSVEVAAPRGATFMGVLQDFAALAKPRISLLVLIVTGFGYALGAPVSIDPVALLHALLGTAGVAVAANALNQVIERELDRRMPRTSNRPLPTGRICPRDASLFAGVLALGGLSWLMIFVNALAALLAAATLLLYLFAYTPLKRRTVLNTVVGAVPGATPPLIGWAAARGQLDVEAWILFAILFVWQLPHFFAIAWMYRDDYRRAGFRMLPRVDPTGRITAAAIIVGCLVLAGVSLLAVRYCGSGTVYAAGAAILGALLTVAACGFSRRRTRTAARRVVLATVAYLPLLYALMLIDRLPG